MAKIDAMSLDEKKALMEKTESRIEEIKKNPVSLDMTRGKPCTQQLDLLQGFEEVLERNFISRESKTDTRNYGGLEGLPEARRLFAAYMEVLPEEILICGNSSLNLMFDTMAQLMTHGAAGCGKPWFGAKTRFLCPVPGYDRHFTICEYFGIEMIPVKMNADGPDMDTVESLASTDESIKGIWCVPKYSNPTGTVYSDATVQRLARMKTKAEDFRVFWDCAYHVHFLDNAPDPLKNLLSECKNAGNPQRPLLFGSTSKISYAGAGLAFMAGSVQTIEWLLKKMFVQTIGHNKLTMLQHVLYFKNMQGILDHMKKHAAILKPKFETINTILTKEIGSSGLAQWNLPKGGYFISLDTQKNCAKETVKLAEQLGVKLTQAGATFPYKKDPDDSNIRIAPSFPSLPDIVKATEILCLCIQSVTLKNLLKSSV